MSYGTTLHFFKEGIKPVWEDPALTKGCRLQFKSEKHHTSKYWEDLLLAMIGEQFGNNEKTVAGIVLNLKPSFDKVAIWLTDSSDEAEVALVKTQLTELLGVEASELEYQAFNEAAKPREGGWQKSGERGRGGFTRGDRGRGGFIRGERGGRGRGGDGFQRADPKDLKQVGSKG